MKRMHTKNEIEAIAEEAGGGFDPSAIEAGNVPQDAVLGLDSENKIVKGNLFGKYVKVIDAPSSETLTEKQIELFKGGVFVNGVFLGLRNPIFLPWEPVADIKAGLVLSADGSDPRLFKIKAYQIQNETNVVSLRGGLDYNSTSNQLSITALKLAGKDFPSYPGYLAGRRYTFRLDNGFMTWQEGSGGLFLHNLTFTDSTNATRYLSVITDSATPFEIVSGTGPTLVQCEDASIIIVPGSGKSLPMYNNKSFHPTVYSLSFPSGSTSVEYTSYDISTLDQDEVKPL